MKGKSYCMAICGNKERSHGWTSQESKKIRVTWPHGQNKKCDIVSPLDVKATPRAVPATPLSGHLMTEDQEYVITVTMIQLALLVSFLLPVFSLLPCSHLYPLPYAVQIPRKTTLTDPAHCPCPCLDGDFRPGSHRSQWLHLDGLPKWDRFLPLITSAVAKHVAAHVVPHGHSFIRNHFRLLSVGAVAGLGSSVWVGFFHLLLSSINPQFLLVQLYLPPNTVFIH